jgi:predicted GIY-YIG superfamily endonuclease
MLYVYLIRSRSHPEKRYIGVTDDVHSRLDAHNRGESTFTARFRPWELVTYIAFADHDRAFAFERYLKAGSGHAFANRHLW